MDQILPTPRKGQALFILLNRNSLWPRQTLNAHLGSVEERYWHQQSLCHRCGSTDNPWTCLQSMPGLAQFTSANITTLSYLDWIQDTLIGFLQESSKCYDCALARKWECWDKCRLQPALLACDHFKTGEIKWTEIGPLFLYRLIQPTSFLQITKGLKDPGQVAETEFCHPL